MHITSICERRDFVREWGQRNPTSGRLDHIILGARVVCSLLSRVHRHVPLLCFLGELIIEGGALTCSASRRPRPKAKETRAAQLRVASTPLLGSAWDVGTNAAFSPATLEWRFWIPVWCVQDNIH